MISVLPELVKTDIVTVLQTALAPAFLLVALGSMLNIFTGRLARVIDRSRLVQGRYLETEGEEHILCVSELRDLQLRIKYVNSAIYFSVLSAIVVCILIGLLFLMGLTNNPALAQIVAGAFTVAVIFLSVALIQFSREVRTGIRDFMIREEYLERSDRDK
ncbi:MAG: DUF2721 domain-containing protein [Sphingomonadales bacterium]|nr:DUF2721 domain-containing protein [Sphingomonadales bacterium]NCP47992.1 DUF2721 domain-containing protein [Sphingomonadales bacterium]PIX65514.1 MAG: DUF2721 domain-containing protein [Sphingomonadales bacterium CG_4_10_14_3_um_filter_58_15]